MPIAIMVDMGVTTIAICLAGMVKATVIAANMEKVLAFLMDSASLKDNFDMPTRHIRDI